MAYFALLDDNDVVLQVVTVSDYYAGKEEQLSSDTGRKYRECGNAQDLPSLRKVGVRNYPGAGHKFDASRNAFIPEQPYPSWVLSDLNEWEAPTPMPMDEGTVHAWNEEKQCWYAAIIPLTEEPTDDQANATDNAR